MEAQLFKPFPLRGLTLRNRVVVSPMQNYSAPDSVPTAWHRTHLARFALGGAGLVMVEATAITPDGQSTDRDLGLWSDDQTKALAELVSTVHDCGAPVGLQLQHAGRKAHTSPPWEGFAPVDLSTGEEVLGPDGKPASHNGRRPRPMTETDMDYVVEAYRNATLRAHLAGVDLIELHMAHGYLLHSFLSPLANTRNDEFGGSLEGRMHFPLDIVQAVRSAWPAEKPMACRISSVDGVGIGWSMEESRVLAGWLKQAGVDLVDCSSGGMPLPSKEMLLPRQPGFQVPFSAALRNDIGVATMAVGLITDPHQAEEVISQGQADLVAIARQMLVDPNWTVNAARALMGPDGFAFWPRPYGWWLERRDRSSHIPR